VSEDRSIKALDTAEERTRDEVPPILQNIAEAYKIAVKTRDLRLARQMLSLLVLHLTDNDIIDLCSEDVDLAEDRDVRVLIPGGKGRQYRRGFIERVGDGVYKSSASVDKARYATLV